MAKLYYDSDVDPRALSGKRVTVLGYGSQGRAQALNLRDSGVDVRAALREGPSAAQARQDGVETTTLDRAAEADAIVFLIPDLAQPGAFEEFVRPKLRGQTLLFSHGFNIRYGLIEPPGGCDVAMVAPKGPGRAVRDAYVRGFGVPSLVAVHQDASGGALRTALAYARAIGATRAGVIETTFAEETETDLFGEQAVLCGGMTELVLAGFETLVEAGYQPEVAYFECLHELKLIVDLLWEGGLERMHRSVSDTAKYGDLTRGERVVDARVRETMRRLLRDVRDGSFAAEWRSEVAAGMPRFRKLLDAELAHPIEETGRRLRAMMQGGAKP
jgi:ketol-acid reductoisomerase